MKILMVYPSHSWYMRIYRKIKKIPNSSLGTKHGIGYIINYAKSNDEIVDFLELESVSWKEFKRIVKNYDIVGYSIISMNYIIAMKAIKINKKENPNVTIIVGGVDPSVSTEKYENNHLIDYIIRGEGEISFLEIIKAKIEELDGNKSIGMNRIDRFKKVIEGKKIENLDNLDFVNRDIVSHSNSPNPLLLKEPHFSILTSRACLYNCKFCAPASKKMFGKKIRTRSAENVVQELIYLKDKYGLKSVTFESDNFLQDREWLINFIDCLKKSKLKINFNIHGRSNNIIKNHDLIKELKILGLIEIFIGIESGSDKMLKYFKKGTSVDMNKKAVNILKNNNIKIQASFISGFPVETKEDIKLTEQFIKENLSNEIFGFSTFVPLPGSFFYEEYKKKGLLFEDSEYSDFNLKKPRIMGVDYYYLSWINFKLFLKYSDSCFSQLSHLIFFVYNIFLITGFYIKYYIKILLNKKLKN